MSAPQERRKPLDKISRPSIHEDPADRLAWVLQTAARDSAVIRNAAERTSTRPPVSPTTPGSSPEWLKKIDDLNRAAMERTEQLRSKAIETTNGDSEWAARTLVRDLAAIDAMKQRKAGNIPIVDKREKEVKPPPQKDIAMNPIQNLPANDDSTFAHEATVFTEEHPADKEEPTIEEVAIVDHDDEPGRPIWKDDYPTSSLFEGLPDIKDLFARLGNDTQTVSSGEERKEQDSPSPAEKAFLYGFFPVFRKDRPEIDAEDKTIRTNAMDEETRRLYRETGGRWAYKVHENQNTLDLIFTARVFRNLYFTERIDPMTYIFDNPELFPTYLLGAIRAQQNPGRLPFKDEETAKKHIESFRKVFGRELGKIGRTSTLARTGDRVHYYTVLMNNDVLGILGEDPTVKDLRFYETVFPPIEETEINREEKVKQAFFRGYIAKTFQKKPLSGDRYSIVANTKDSEQRRRFSIVMGDWGEVTDEFGIARAAIPMKKLPFLNGSSEPEETITSDEEAIAYFAGLWLARDLPNRGMDGIEETIAARLETAINEYVGERLVRVRANKTTLAIIDPSQKLMPKLKEVLDEAIPYFDEIFPKAA